MEVVLVDTISFIDEQRAVYQVTALPEKNVQNAIREELEIPLRSSWPLPPCDLFCATLKSSVAPVGLIMPWI